MSGIMSDLIDQKLLMRRVSKKRDNAPVPVELWLYWLNARISIPLSFDEWNSYVTIIQEIFMLTRWKRNLMCSYVVWLKEKLTDRGFRVNNSNPIIGEEVVRDSSGKLTWVKLGQRKYKREAHFRKLLEEDQIATRDCIRRAANSSWCDWNIGSRSFFWR